MVGGIVATDRHGPHAEHGEVGDVHNWYTAEYAFASGNILLQKSGERYIVTIDNQR